MTSKIPKAAAKKTQGRVKEVLLCSYGLYPEQITFETLEELRRSDIVFLNFSIPRLEAWLGPHPQIVVAAPRARFTEDMLRKKARVIAGAARRGKRVAFIS